MSAISHAKKKKKHPKDMTTDEAMRHLFTHKGHRLIKKHVREVECSSTKKE
jgi:hypothetical protein